MTTHSFDTDIANEVGVNAAILYANIDFWVTKNEANQSERHLHEGRYWTYNSVAAWSKIFYYMSVRSIRTALAKLEEANLVYAGSFNADKRDRTKWYSPNRVTAFALTDKSTLSEESASFVTSDKPLPDNNPDQKPDSMAAARQAFDFYNQLVKERKLSWSQSRVLSDKLKAGLNARIKEYSLADVKTFMERVADQPWANGGFDGRNEWRPALHYFTQPSAYAKHFDKLMARVDPKADEERNKQQLLENLFVQFAGSNQWNGGRYGFEKHPYDTGANYPKELYEKNNLVPPGSVM